MISFIKINTNRIGITEAARRSKAFNVIRYEAAGRCMYKATISHKDLERPLEGVYTIPTLNKMLG